MVVYKICSNKGKEEIRKTKETIERKAKKNAVIGVQKGFNVPLAQKALPVGIICHCNKAPWHVAVKQGTIIMPYKMTNEKLSS